MLFWFTMSFININTNQVEYTIYAPADKTYASLAECKKDNYADINSKDVVVRSRNGDPLRIVFDCADKLINK